MPVIQNREFIEFYSSHSKQISEEIKNLKLGIPQTQKRLLCYSASNFNSYFCCSFGLKWQIYQNMYFTAFYVT
jgi:hypothetical protein